MPQTHSIRGSGGGSASSIGRKSGGGAAAAAAAAAAGQATKANTNARDGHNAVEAGLKRLETCLLQVVFPKPHDNCTSTGTSDDTGADQQEGGA